MTRLDTHNQPAVIEAFNAWPRTLTRVPRCRILTLSVNLFSTRRVDERRARTAENIVCFCLEESNWVWSIIWE